MPAGRFYKWRWQTHFEQQHIANPISYYARGGYLPFTFSYLPAKQSPLTIQCTRPNDLIVPFTSISGYSTIFSTVVFHSPSPTPLHSSISTPNLALQAPNCNSRQPLFASAKSALRTRSQIPHPQSVWPRFTMFVDV